MDKDKVSGQGQGKWTGQGKLNQRKDFDVVEIESQELSDFG